MNLKRKIGNSIHILHDLMYNKKITDKDFKLLLIKDSEGDIRPIEEMLHNIKDIKYELNYVDRLSRGVFQLPKSNFDLILLDLELSDSQGLNNLLKLHSHLPDVPIILLSYLTNENIAMKAMIEGVQDFLIKDQVDSNLLVRSIFYAIERFKIMKKLKKEQIAFQDLEEKFRKYRKAYNHNEFYKDLLSHDIKNYLQNVGLSIEICEFFLDKPEELKNQFKIMQNQLNKAAKLISNVQKISKLEETEPILEPIKVNEVLKEAIKFAQENFEWREINIQIDSAKEVFYVQADTFLVDVFENILHNAGKYNKEPLIEILIRISKVQRDGINYLQLEFIDNGVGIPDVRKEKVFQRINRGDSSVRGMGLGLSLVKKIITSYKGQVWVEDRVAGDYSKGSNFIMLIPEAC